MNYRRFWRLVNLAGRGEMIRTRQFAKSVEYRRQVRIPVLRFHFKFSDHEVPRRSTCRRPPRHHPGDGACRSATSSEASGADLRRAASSFTKRDDAHGRRLDVRAERTATHDVKNLFVADGGPFITQSDKNPTWTILALSMRTSQFIVEERKKGSL